MIMTLKERLNLHVITHKDSNSYENFLKNEPNEPPARVSAAYGTYTSRAVHVRKFSYYPFHRQGAHSLINKTLTCVPAVSGTVYYACCASTAIAFLPSSNDRGCSMFYANIRNGSPLHLRYYL